MLVLYRDQLAIRREAGEHRVRSSSTLFKERMKRLAMLALLVAVAACGSDSSGPTDRFSGTWIGNAYVGTTDTVSFVVAASQSGSAVTGTGTASSGGTSIPFTLTGTSTPPSLSLVITTGTDTLTYVGSYVTADSVAGTATEGSTVVPLSLKKQ